MVFEADIDINIVGTAAAAAAAAKVDIVSLDVVDEVDVD